MQNTTDRPVVVVAEDDPAIRRLIEVTVKNSGCDVVSAPDGDKALALIRERRPDLAIMDVSMPLRTGIEVGKALQSDPETKGIPVMFLTSHAQEHDVIEGFRSGAVDYIFKPFSPRELQIRIRAVLDRT